MIVCPPGFYQSQQQGAWFLQPPDALKLLPIRYRAKQQPLRSLRDIVNELIAEHDEWTPLHASLPETFTTAEGEFGALSSLLVRRGPQLGYLHIAAVFGDDSVDIIDAPVFDLDAVESTALLVKQLAYTLTLGLGYRKRRYLYTPPLGWTRIAAGLVTRFYPPDFPSHRAMLVVHPAVPRTISPQALCTSLIERYRKKGLLFETDGGATPMTSTHGLHGLAFCLVGPAHKHAAQAQPAPSTPLLLQDLLVFADAHYLYAMVFESTTVTRREELATLLSSVATSVRPLPSPPSLPKPSPTATLSTSIYL